MKRVAVMVLAIMVLVGALAPAYGKTVKEMRVLSSKAGIVKVIAKDGNIYKFKGSTKALWIKATMKGKKITGYKAMKRVTLGNIDSSNYYRYMADYDHDNQLTAWHECDGSDYLEGEERYYNEGCDHYNVWLVYEEF